MGLDLTPRCAKCGCELDVTTMRALPDGKGYVCKDCNEAGKNTSSPFTVDKKKLRTLPPRDETPSDYIATSDDIFDQKEYVCNTCGYNFKKTSDFKVSVCPYCGKRDIRQKVEQSADVLLD